MQRVGRNVIDALTLTMPCNHSEYGEVRDIMEHFLSMNHALGYQKQIFKHRGGYEGVLCGGVRFGEGRQGIIISCTSSVSEEVAISLAKYDLHCTRVDIQITVKFSDGPVLPLENHLYQAQEMEKTADNYPKVKYTRGTRSGFTIYVGSRSSDRMLRMYDKEAESGETRYKGCLRYEIEYKAPRSEVLWGAFSAKLREHETWATIETWLLATVLNEYTSRGISPYYSLGEGAGTGANLSLPRASTDVQKKLKWLARTVRPSITFLRAHGALQEALQALAIEPTDLVGDHHETI